jgi:hypothetical protein
MFERYTENARRVIFFSRYEAAQRGSPFIETGHLLLGVLRESAPLLRELGITTVEPIAEDCRKTLESKGAVEGDLPLSNASKRVLAYAAEEAERQSKWIGPQHLAMGLLREGDTASEILKRHGITLEQLRGLRTLEGISDRVRAVGFALVPVEFVCDNQPVAEADVTFAMPWPRVGETIVFGDEDRREFYKVVDIGHFYAPQKEQPKKERARLAKIVVTLKPSED